MSDEARYRITVDHIAILLRANMFVVSEKGLSAMPISIESVEYILFSNLRAFRKRGYKVTPESVLGAALEEAKVSGISARSLFKDVSRYEIWINDGGKKDWPEKWLDFNCLELAKAICMEEE